MMELLATWRAEIAAELATAQVDLETAEASFDAALAAARAAKRDRRALAESIGRTGHADRLSAALGFRLKARDLELSREAGPPVIASGAIAAALWRIRDLRQGLDELDQIAASAPAAEPIEATG